MRLAATTIVAAIAACSFAQITPAEQPIQDAFAKLRGESEVMFTLDGIDKVGPRTNSLSSNVFFKWDTLDPDKAPVKSEINDWVNGAHTRRIVGDGTTLWNYDFGRNAYTTYRYTSYSGSQPEGFRSNMLGELSTASQGPSVFLARAIKEIFSGKEAQYRTWLPMAQITVLTKASANPSFQDPVVDRKYDASDLDYYVIYTYNSRLMRSAAFRFSRPDTSSEFRLSEIYYADKQQINASTPRIVDWMISINSGPLPTVARYTFVPPTTAKAIANVRGGGG